MIKFLFDYFPIICFFIAYKLYGIYVATVVTIIASAVQLCVYWLAHRSLEKQHVITFAAITLLGGATLIFHNPIFIKWKPSIIYWVFSIILCGSHFIGKKTIAERLMGEKIVMPNKKWITINACWALFFFIMGFLNIYVVYHYSTDIWVNFKLFGTLGLTFLFVILQMIYMWPHIDKEASD